MFGPKCSVCGKKFRAGDKITVTGKWPSFFTGRYKWPHLANSRLWHDSCINKKSK